MSVYFENFPVITYKNKKVVDISRRNDFIESIMKDPTIFLPVTLNDGEKPEDIAYFYYGNVRYTNFILLLNGCYNRYEDWLFTEKALRTYIIQKYETVSGKTGDDEVMRWTMNETLLDNVLYFVAANGIQYSVDTVLIKYCPVEFHNLRDTESGQLELLTDYILPTGLVPYRIYEHEYDTNENKRQIFVVNKNYISKVEKQFKDLMDT